MEELDLNELKALRVRGQEIPTLGEALVLAKKLDLGLVVEMKEEGLEELVAEALSGSNCIVTSYYHSSLYEIKDISDLRDGDHHRIAARKACAASPLGESGCYFSEENQPPALQGGTSEGSIGLPLDRQYKRFGGLASPVGCGRPGNRRSVSDQRSPLNQPVQATGRSNCEYYPCHHFPDQDCTHCFCPLYPCKDTDLGKYVRTKRGKRFWTCIDCRLVHRPRVAKYLAQHPETSTSELKALQDG